MLPNHFDGNGGLIDGEETKQESRYYGTPYGEMPDTVRENFLFLGWSTEPDAEQDKEEDKKPDVIWQEKELIGEEDVFCHAGEQRLYAQWDESPVIEAKDQYYSLTDARSGRITEKMLLQQACAKDRESSSEDNPEGILKSGGDEEKNTVFAWKIIRKKSGRTLRMKEPPRLLIMQKMQLAMSAENRLPFIWWILLRNRWRTKKKRFDLSVKNILIP